MPKEATPSFYLTNILPLLLRARVVHFRGFGNSLSFDPIPFDIQVFFNHTVMIYNSGLKVHTLKAMYIIQHYFCNEDGMLVHMTTVLSTGESIFEKEGKIASLNDICMDSNFHFGA